VVNTLTITEGLYESLRAAVFSVDGVEGAAYVMCGLSRPDGETRLLAREVVPVAENHYLERTATRLSIVSDSFVPLAKRAAEKGEGMVFVHSHPGGASDFSEQDERELPRLMEYVSQRAPKAPHGCLVLGGGDAMLGRVWTPEAWAPLTRIRVIGQRFRFWDSGPTRNPLPQFFDRQVRAFGPDIQTLLGSLHIGVVGAGGIGSAVIEQLSRLGVGTLSVFDGDIIEKSNLSRVYGATASDDQQNKAIVQGRHVALIGIGTAVRTYPTYITEVETARKLRECDIVFGCADKEAPRAILGRLALRYVIPVIDTAVKIRAVDGQITGVYGRITILLPGEACLFCRGRISPDRIRAETLPPEQRDTEVEEGYADEWEGDEPAVITFTTAVAAQAVSELLHRLTGFMGEKTRSSEVLMYLDQRMVRANRELPLHDCQCMVESKWGRGDTLSFLEMSWAEGTR